MTTEERDRLGKAAELAYHKALEDLPGLGSRNLPEVWARTAEAVAAALLAEAEAARRAQQEAAQQEQARILSRKGQIEEAFRMLRDQSELPAAGELAAKLLEIRNRLLADGLASRPHIEAIDGVIAMARAIARAIAHPRRPAGKGPTP